MKRKIESESDRPLEMDGGRQWANGEYGEHRGGKSRRKPGMALRLNTEQNGKTSTYSSSSRLTSLMKGHSMSEADSFKGSESMFYNQLA